MRLLAWKLFSLSIKIVSSVSSLMQHFKAAQARNRPLRQHLLPLHRSTDADAGKVVTLPWHACQSLMHLRLLVVAWRKSPSWRRESVSSCYAPTPSYFPLSSHLDSGTFIPWLFRPTSCFFRVLLFFFLWIR